MINLDLVAPIIQRKGEFGIVFITLTVKQLLYTISTYYRHRTISQCQADPRPRLNDEPAAHDSVDEEKTVSGVLHLTWFSILRILY